jgi:cyanobactin maturation PatA/PatG family protease
VPQLVFALGQLGYDLVSEARLDGLAQTMAGVAGASAPERLLALDPRRMLAHFDEHPWDAAAVEWTLSLDGTAIYAVRPQGPFAADVYKQLRRFLREQLEEGVERVSIPGVVAGKANLLLGQVVPVVVPELRGMFSWTAGALTDSVAGPAPSAEAPQHERDAHAQRKAGVRNFLDRVYHGQRNLGLTPQDRAINFAATNAFAFEKVYEAALKEKMELESVNVVRSPICRPGSDCWDVEVYFFYPERQVQTVRRVYRFTVDVSDLVPVTVGPTRSWFTR